MKHKHDWVRERGPNDRFRCTSCGALGYQTGMGRRAMTCGHKVTRTTRCKAPAVCESGSTLHSRGRCEEHK